MDFKQLKNQYYKLIKALIYRIPANHRPPEMTINDIITDAILYQHENNVDFVKAILSVYSRMVLSYRRQNPILYKRCNDIARQWQIDNREETHKIQNRYNKRACENLSDAYIIRLLKQKRDKSSLINNPNIIQETRQRLLERRNKKQPLMRAA